MPAEGPVLDTSCAAPDAAGPGGARQGYKVALTGEGADEALAGYVWFKTQKVRDAALPSVSATDCPAPLRNLVARLDRRTPDDHPARAGHRRRPHRPAGHLRDDRPGQAVPLLRGDVDAARATTAPTTTWTSPTTGSPAGTR